MGQSFSLTGPLIDKHGNFGSPADPPAAARYTECRLSQLAMEMLAGIDEGTVDFEPNYDASRTEPVVLPARFPNLLVNGAQGIAVGMATNIPPHNLVEVCNAALKLIDTPDDVARAAHAHREGPRLPDRRPHHGRRRDQGRVPHRARHDPRPGPPRDRGVAARHGDRAHRGAVPDERRRDRGQARRARRGRARSTASATSATSRARARPGS